MMGKVTLRNLAAHKIRLVLTAVAVILGVAFVAGTLIFTDSMNKQFDDLFSRVGKNVAVDVRAKKALGGDGNGQAPQPVPGAEGVMSAVFATEFVQRVHHLAMDICGVGVLDQGEPAVGRGVIWRRGSVPLPAVPRRSAATSLANGCLACRADGERIEHGSLFR